MKSALKDRAKQRDENSIPSQGGLSTVDFQRITSSIEKQLTAALESIIMEACYSGDWGDVRGTADSLIALNRCLPETTFLNLRTNAAKWLTRNKIEKSEFNVNWEEEVWDTSVAMIALSHEKEKNKQVIDGAVKGLQASFVEEHNNWNFEPWETSWALLAIFEALSPHLDEDVLATCNRALKWLQTYIGVPEPGLLINWHYTALFLLVAKRYSDYPPFTEEYPDTCRMLKQYIDICLQRILDVLPVSEEGLWTHEVWSNGLVLWALGECNVVATNTTGVTRIVEWFSGQLLTSFLEDRAFACIGLYELLLSLKAQEYLPLSDGLAGLVGAAEANDLGDILNVCMKIVEKEISQDKIKPCLAAQLEKNLAGRCPDFVLRAPFITSSEHEGYYTLNLYRKYTDLAVIIAVTLAVTLLTLASTERIPAPWAWIIGAAPIVIGAFATVASLFGFSFRDYFGRKDVK